MRDFIQKLHLYQTSPMSFKIPGNFLFADSANYIKMSILSIFDGSTNNWRAKFDGVIDSKEFETVSKKD